VSDTAAEVKTVVVTDVVDGTKLLSSLGDGDLAGRHHRITAHVVLRGAIARFLAALTLLVAIAGVPATLRAQDTGRVTGQLSDSRGQGIGGVAVQLVELKRAEIADDEGRFVLHDVRAGTYTIVFTLGAHSVVEAGVRVQAGMTTTIDKKVDWALSFADTITVSGVSRRAERIVDAPAAATTLTREEIARQASNGQPPRLLAFTPGVELTQTSLNDFNFNARGFNSAFNRRVLTLVDGRDPSIPGLLGAQEWGAMLSPDDTERVEFVRGPGAALYGAGAFNGVLLVTSKAPRDSLGGRLRIIGGELGTQRYDVRHAADLGRGWYYKVLGGYQRSGNFTRSRVGTVEYAPGVLPQEAVAPPLDRYRSRFGNVRFDKYLVNDRVVTMEAGLSQFEGTTNVSDLGRVQQTNVSRPWFRVNVNAPHWNVMAATTKRSAPDQVVLSSGGSMFLDSYNTSVEVQGNRHFAGGRGRAVGGSSFGVQSADSSNPQGQATIFSGVKGERREAIYGQVDFDLAETLKGVLSLRWDKSSRYDPQWSPRAALVYTPRSGHTVRVTFNHAFKSPTLSELFVHVPVAPPVNLSALEQALAPALGGVGLGFQSIPVLGIGNEDLTVEEITSLEFGYNAVLGRRLFLTASVYKNRLQNFTTTLLPQLGTSFGRLNPRFGPYKPPARLSADSATLVTAMLQATVPTLFPIMSNDSDGSPIFVAISNRNYGKVDTQGLELGMYYAVASGWMWAVSYDAFGFTVDHDVPESPLIPNAPAHQFSTDLSYARARFDAAVRYRWVDTFPWATGIFIGPVKSFGVVDVNLNRKLTDTWGIGVDVSNLLNNEHYEVFGGDLLGRRALANLTCTW
jgi:outer membrane receptor for ferrienterochelin and colicins